MSGSGLCRAMWEFIGFRFGSPAFDKYESNRSHDIVWWDYSPLRKWRS